jgi:hypothetical protein
MKEENGNEYPTFCSGGMPVVPGRGRHHPYRMGFAESLRQGAATPATQGGRAMTVWREIVSMRVLNGRIVVTLSCKHSYEYKRGYFRNKTIFRNARGVQIWRCTRCEQEATQ